ncbi:MAG: hypothetical protein ABL964_11025 [Steroidobacteraceae bacterium]
MSTADESTEEARDAAFAARTRDLLLDSVEHLDAGTRSRLTQARHAALDQLEPAHARRGYLSGGWLAPAGGLAAVVLVGLVWVGTAPQVDPVSQSASVRPEAGGTAVDDLALMADAENLELAEEIEFYSWLETEAVLPATSGGVG